MYGFVNIMIFRFEILMKRMRKKFNNYCSFENGLYKFL